jgi:hypothetical protein
VAYGWRALQNLGAPSASDLLTWDPDASTWGNNHLDVVARTEHAQLAVKSYSGTLPAGHRWGAWVVHDESGPLLSSPTAASTAVDALDVFWLGTNHTLVRMHWSAQGGWTGPFGVPGVTNAASGPDAVAWSVGTAHLDVLYRATDNRLWDVSYDQPRGGWQTPQVVDPSHALPVPPARVDPAGGTTGSGTVSTYYTGTDGVVYWSTYASGAWSGWSAVPGSHRVTSGPDASNQSATHVDLVARQPSGLTITSRNDPGGWSPWQFVR